MAPVTRSSSKRATRSNTKKATGVASKASAPKKTSKTPKPIKATKAKQPAKKTGTKAPKATPEAAPQPDPKPAPKPAPKPSPKPTSKPASKAVTRVAKKGSAAASKPRGNGRTKSDLVPKRLLERFNSYTIAQIKAELQSKKVEASGLKQELFMSLIQAEKSGCQAQAQGQDEEPVSAVDDGDLDSLPDYESDPAASQEEATAPESGASCSQQAQEEQPKGPYDCVAHFSGEDIPGPKMEDDERPLPHYFFIPQAAMDMVLSDLIDASPDHVTLVLQRLVAMNPGYLEMKTRDVLQWHMPERYLLARIRQHHDQGLLKKAPFKKVCQTKWGNKLIKDWRTAKVMDVLDGAPALLREWSEALKAGKLSYSHMPTNYAENPNKQWCFGRALLFTPCLLNLFKQLVADGKLELPDEKDTAQVTEEDLAGCE